MCVKLNSLFDRVTQKVKQSINIRIVCPSYILEFRNKKSHVLQVYLGAWATLKLSSKITSQLQLFVIIVFKHYP